MSLEVSKKVRMTGALRVYKVYCDGIFLFEFSVISEFDVFDGISKSVSQLSPTQVCICRINARLWWYIITIVTVEMFVLRYISGHYKRI